MTAVPGKQGCEANVFEPGIDEKTVETGSFLLL